MNQQERKRLSKVTLGLPPAEIVPEHTRPCPQCGRDRLVSEFEGLPIDKRCRDCLPPYELTTVREKKLSLAANSFQQIIAKTKSADYKVPHLNQLLSALFSKWGGVEPFISQYHEVIQVLVTRSPASAANHFANILKLLRDSSKMQQDDDIAAMNEEQTRREMQLGLFEIMAKMTVDDAQRQLLMEVIHATGLLPADAPDVLEHA